MKKLARSLEWIAFPATTTRKTHAYIMNTISQTDAPSTLNCPRNTRYPTLELASSLRALPCEHRGLIQDLRDYSLCNGGIPDDPDFLIDLAASFRFSRYKFRKYWATLRKFFIEIDGFLFYEGDQILPSESLEVTEQEPVKSYRHQKAAAARWGRLHDALHMQPDASASPMHDATGCIPIPPLTLPLFTPSEDSLVTAAADKQLGIVDLAAAVESTPKMPMQKQEQEFQGARRLIVGGLYILSPRTGNKFFDSRFSDLSPGMFQRIVQAALKVEPDLTDERLCEAIWGGYKGQDQKTAGLFLTSVPAWLQNNVRAAVAS